MKKYFEAIEGGGGFDYQKEYYKLSSLLKEKEDEIDILMREVFDWQNVNNKTQSELSKYKALAEGYAKLLKIADCPDILLENPWILFASNPTPEDISWAEDVIKKYEATKP